MSQHQTKSERQADPVFAEAAAWHAKLREPDVASQTHAEFLDWLKRHPSHLDAYDEAERLWVALGNSADRAERDEAAIQALVSSAKPSRTRRTARNAALGLCFLAALATGDWIRRGGLDDLRADYVVPTGAMRTIVLADGTSIELNTGTALAVDLAPDQRRVRLFRGEAYLNVAKDPARPFIVDTPDGETRVTGTIFNVRSESGATHVGLIEGSVQLSSRRQPETKLSLRPGQEGDITSSGPGAPRAFDAEAATAWRRGQLVFFRTPLSEVVEELNRYHRGRIVMLGSRLGALPVTGVFDTRDPSGAIDIIEGALGVSSFRLSTALIVLR